MPVRGVKPLPTAVKKLKGTLNPSRYNHNEPQPPMFTRNDIPPELEGNTAAMREWVRLVPMLRACRQITEADRGALIALCLEWSVYINSRNIPRTQKSNHPAMKALQHCLKLWPELGLTPSSRTRVITAGPSPLTGGDSFSEFDETETSGEPH